MSTHPTTLFPEDTQALAWLASDALQHPSRYARGQAFLAESFSPSAVSKRRRAPVNSATPEACVGEALVWALDPRVEMSPVRAEAICLLWLEFAGHRESSGWLHGTTGELAVADQLRRSMIYRLAPRVRPVLMRAIEMIRPTEPERPHTQPTRAASAPTPAAPSRLPLSDAAQAVYAILDALPEVEGRTARQLVAQLGRAQPRITISEDRVKRDIRNELKPYGIRNKRGAGYYIPKSTPGRP